MTVGSGLSLNPGETGIAKIVSVIRQLIEGRSNACGTFTLGASTTATTVAAVTCGPNSVVRWMPKTQHASWQMATLYCDSVGPGTFSLKHASNANNDQTFDFIVIG